MKAPAGDGAGVRVAVRGELAVTIALFTAYQYAQPLWTRITMSS